MKTTSIIILFIILMAGCHKDNPDVPVIEAPKGSLSLISSFQLDILEPSGLSFGPTGNLLIVSDNANKVYETTLQGEIIRTLNYEGSDLEAVVFNPDDNIVAVAEERKREIVLLDYENGDEQARYKIDVKEGNDNKGLEGLSYSLNNKAYYIVNEDLPGEMIVWNPIYGNINTTPLTFASDYSAIFVDTENSLLWIVSDESQTVYRCDYKANVLQEYLLPDTKYEGIAVDVDNMILYVVNDGSAKLDIFKIKN